MAATVPARVAWAVDVLDPAPAERLLEVGGGPGVSAGLICARLTTGHLLAVDRSELACRRTAERNAAHVAAGRLTVQQAALRDLELPPASRDKVLALDVNLFWVADPAPELAVLRRALRPGGELHVLYGVGPSSPERVVEAVAAALRAHGFVDLILHDGPAGSGVSARST